MAAVRAPAGSLVQDFPNPSMPLHGLMHRDLGAGVGDPFTVEADVNDSHTPNPGMVVR